MHDDRSHQAALGLRITDLRTLGRNHQVARRHQTGAARKCIPRHRSDCRLRESVQTLKQVRKLLKDRDRRLLAIGTFRNRGRLFQIHSRAKRRAGSREYDDSSVLLHANLVDPIAKRGHKREKERCVDRDDSESESQSVRDLPEV